MTILPTSDAGLISSGFALDWLGRADKPDVNLDQNACAGSLQGDGCHVFVQSDIGDCGLVDNLFLAVLNILLLAKAGLVPSSFRSLLARNGYGQFLLRMFKDNFFR